MVENYLFMSRVCWKAQLSVWLRGLRGIFIPTCFPRIFLEVPLEKQVEFKIDLVPAADPIAKEPYCFALLKMKEFSTQLHELLDKDFIRLRILPSGAPIIFVNNKDGSYMMCIEYRVLLW